MRRDDFSVVDSLRDDDIPSTTPDALLQGRPVLVLAPHPDDESLGCGALLAAAFQQSQPGRHAHVICLTDGAASHPGSRAVAPAQLAALRRQELCLAVTHLGGTPEHVIWIGAPDGALICSDDNVRAVADVARRTGAGLLMAPSPLDPHCDHVAGAQIGQSAARQIPGLRLGFYPVWSRWHGGGRAPVPQGTHAVRLPARPYQARKAAAIAAHRSQQGKVVLDDPEGFEMPPGFATFFAERDEVYFLQDRGVIP